MDRGTDSGRDPHPARQSRVAHRAGGPRSRPTDLPLLRRRQPNGVRREVARGARLRERGLARRRLHRLEAQRPSDRAAAHARRRKAAALQPSRPHPRGRRGGTAQAARLARAATRRGRARLAGGALPGGGGGRAGGGRLGIVDDDRVDASNLQRQVLHSTGRLGDWKAESAKRTLEELNPDVEVVPYIERLTSENVERILADGWDVIVDGADNFPTRYLINDAAVWHDIPLVHGSIYRFEGQATVFKPGAGPCYRCLFPQPPPPELAPSCAEGGVLGVLPGIVGSLQASEALKLCLGIGEPLVGRLLLFDALATEFSEVTLSRDPACPVCGDSPTITEYVDYVEFCSGRPAHA